MQRCLGRRYHGGLHSHLRRSANLLVLIHSLWRGALRPNEQATALASVQVSAVAANFRADGPAFLSGRVASNITAASKPFKKGPPAATRSSHSI